MARNCPDCDVALSQRSFFGVLLDACPVCGGIYFDEGEVNQLRGTAGDKGLEVLDDLIQPESGYLHIEENMHRRCPACAATMHRFRYMYSSPVFLDSCEGCGGVWIENGELKQMKAYVESERTQPKPDASKERDELAATVDALILRQNDKIKRAHWAVSAIASAPWL